jgi:Gluconate 2-dehydrogenase subunit 3
MGKADNESDHAKPKAAISRRDWLLNFGSTVVLSGFRGAPGPWPKESQTSAASLPPGLYQPSLNDLTHAFASGGPFFPIPPGAGTEYVRPRSVPFVPQAFSVEDFRFVRRLVEIILGEDLKKISEQPALGVPVSIYDEVAEWIDLVVSEAPRTRTLAQNLSPEQRALAVAYFGTEDPVRELETFEPERVCREGLAHLDEESHRRFAKGFLDADAAGQLELVWSISDTRPDTSVKHAGTRLFDFLKAESARGFYTSRLGMKELDYTWNPFYGQSPGCTHSHNSTNEPE